METPTHFWAPVELPLGKRDDSDDIYEDVADLLNDYAVALLGLKMCWPWQHNRKGIARAHIRQVALRMGWYLDLYDDYEIDSYNKNVLTEKINEAGELTGSWIVTHPLRKV